MSTQLINGTVDPSELSNEPASEWVLVDVRTPGEFAGTHIEGSLNAPLGSLKQHAASIRKRATGKRVALVCRTGRRAEEARRHLQAEGIDALHVLEGGVVSWEQAGLPLLRGKQGMSLERQVRVAAGTLVVLGVLLGVMAHPAWLGLSAFVGAGLVFAGLTDTCGMAMALAKMPWNRAAAACPKE